MISIYVSQEEDVSKCTCKGKYEDIITELSVGVYHLLDRMPAESKIMRDSMIDHLICTLKILKENAQ